MKQYSIIILILILWTGLQAKGGVEAMDSSSGDFLNQNLNEYWQKAWEAYQSGDYKGSAEIYLQGLRYDITNGANIYNLACCYGLMGEEKLAAKYLEFAIRNGFENYNHITNDPDFEKVKASEEFTAVVDSLQRYLEKKKQAGVKELWFSSEAYSKTYLRLPDDYDPAKSYPLLVGLHGYGATGESFIKLWDSFKEHDFIFICPETFYPFSLGKEMGYSWITWTEDKMINKQIEEKTEEYVEKVTKKISENYSISKVYLLGFSQGCGLAFTAGIRYHELFDGLMCFGGWLDTERLTDQSLEAGKNLKVFIAHGKEDKMVDFRESKSAESKLKEIGYEINFYEFEGGHSVPAEALQNAQEWFGF